MAPATLAGATPRPVSAGGRWDRDSVIDAIREWVATYGEPPRAADWNPSSAKWSGQLWRVERYRAGRADGSPWPALNSAKRPFGGSLTAALRAAGFEPARPGPTRRRDVDPQQAGRAVMSPEGRAMIEAALERAREAERALTRLAARAERASARAERLARERDRARAQARRARRKLQPEAQDAAVVPDLRRELAGARMDAAGARTTANRLAARLERSEATVAALRAERRELRADRDRTAAELEAAEGLLAAARAEASRMPEVTVVREQAPEANVLREALAAAAAAERCAEAAERRAARAERELRETVAAVKGEPRRLTAAELAELRADGPSGPAVMAAALRALAAARAAGSRTGTRAALGEIAQAAVTWQERI